MSDDVKDPGAPKTPEATAGQGVPGDAATPPASDAPTAGDAPAPSQQEIAVRAALESVMDPEINLSVIDLGLIREISFTP